MPWNCDDKPKLRRRSRLKRKPPASCKPDAPGAGDNDDGCTTVLLALEPFPEAKRAVIRALYQKLGYPDEYEDDHEEH